MAVFVTSLGFGNAWYPLPRNNGESAMATAWLPTRSAAIAAIDAYSRRIDAYSRVTRPKATVPAIFSMCTLTIAPFAVPGT